MKPKFLGMNPADLKGTNSAFYSGTTFSDYDLEWDTHFRGGYGIMGRNRCMNANRVSYWLDTSGKITQFPILIF